MKKGFSIRLFTGLIILLFASIVGSMQPVRAENETKELTSIAREQDLAVMFLFDKENVEITFISPSGDRVTKETEGVDFADGDLWATYRIHNAQLGTWSVEYDRGANEKIEYSIIKDDYGLWITSFEMTESDEEDAFAVKFQADCEDLNGYNFEIYAENTEDASESHKLDYGYAATGEEWNGIVRMTGVSSGKYVLKLEIYAEDGDVELFDNASTEEFSYRNPNEPAAIDNFKISVNQGLGICSLDWSEVAERSHAEYRLKAWQDGELIYENKYDSSVKKDDVFFTDGAKTLEISLSHKVNGIWSEPRKRTLDLEKESLTNVTKQGNGASQIVLHYKTTGDRELLVKINDKEGYFRVSGEDDIAFEAKEGYNSIYASMDSDDLITYVVEGDTYYDAIPPSITLYEDLDGKSFTAEEITILGKIEGGDVLLVNGEEAEVHENGEFACIVSLKEGANEVELEAVDVNGNGTKAVLALTRKAPDAEPVRSFTPESKEQSGWKSYLPLILTLAASLLIIVLVILFMKKKEGSAKSRLVGNLIFWDVIVLLAEVALIILYFRQRAYGTSLEFFDLAEQSGSEALANMKKEVAYRLYSIVGAVVLGISILATVLCAVVLKKKPKQAEKQDEQ